MYPRSAILPLVLLLAPLPGAARQGPAETVRGHYEAAEAKRRAGDLAGAEAEFTAILAEGYHRVGRVYLAQSNPAAALAALESAAAYRPDSSEVLVDLAIADFRLARYDKAREVLGRVLAREPRNPAARHMLGKTYFMDGEYAKSAAELETALALAPGDYDVAYTLGLAYLKKGEQPRAARVYAGMVARLGEKPALRVLIGRAYRETGFLPEAIEEFKKAIALDADFPRVHYYLGLTYLLKDGAARLEDAAREFRVELDAHPDEYFANYYLGILAIIERTWEPAIGYLEKAASLQPTNPDPYFHLGQAYQGAERHEKAIEVLRKSIALNPDVAHNGFQVGTGYFRLGQSLLRTGQTAEAEKALQLSAELKSKSLKKDEQKTEAYLSAQSIAEHQGALPASAAEAVAAPAMDPGKAEALRAEADYYAKVLAAAHNNVGLLRAARQDFRGAAGQFALAAKWNPGHEGVNFNLGLANFKADLFKEAVAPLEAELAARPANLAAKRLLGMSYFMLADYYRATTLLSEVAALSPDDAGLAYPLALALAKVGRTDESNRLIQRMLARGDKTPQVHVLLGQAYYEEGDTAKALEELRAALAIDAKTPLAHFYSGMIHVRMGKFDDAVREFEAELANRPDDTQARYHLAFALLARQDSKRGVEVMRDVIARRPDYADARYELGKALLAQGAVAEAVTHLEVAAKLDPEAPHVHYQLGRAYVAAGRQAEGESHLETSRRLKEKARTEASQ
jgi:tetratricopeptide (TPR) repeat protein